MPSTTIRVSDKTHACLHELAREVGVSMQDVVEQAIELYRRKVLFAQANAAYAALLSDPAAAEDWEQEFAAWDTTLQDGLEDV